MPQPKHFRSARLFIPYFIHNAYLDESPFWKWQMWPLVMNRLVSYILTQQYTLQYQKLDDKKKVLNDKIWAIFIV